MEILKNKKTEARGRSTDSRDFWTFSELNIEILRTKEDYYYCLKNNFWYNLNPCLFF